MKDSALITTPHHVFLAAETHFLFSPARKRWYAGPVK